MTLFVYSNITIVITQLENWNFAFQLRRGRARPDGDSGCQSMYQSFNPSPPNRPFEWELRAVSLITIFLLPAPAPAFHHQESTEREGRESLYSPKKSISFLVTVVANPSWQPWGRTNQQCPLLKPKFQGGKKSRKFLILPRNHGKHNSEMSEYTPGRKGGKEEGREPVLPVDWTARLRMFPVHVLSSICGRLLWRYFLGTVATVMTEIWRRVSTYNSSMS